MTPVNVECAISCCRDYRFACVVGYSGALSTAGISLALYAFGFAPILGAIAAGEAVVAAAFIAVKCRLTARIRQLELSAR